MLERRDFTLILAQNRKGFIGRSGSIPWSDPIDMAHFKNVTHGGTVVMGSWTWNDLCHIHREAQEILPGRTKIVVSKALCDTCGDWIDQGTMSACSPMCAAFLSNVGSLAAHKAFVIGGEQLASAMEDFIEDAIITTVDNYIMGDARLPSFLSDKESWVELDEIPPTPGGDGLCVTKYKRRNRNEGEGE